MLSNIDRELLQQLCLLENFTLDEAAAICTNPDAKRRISDLATAFEGVTKEGVDQYGIESELKSQLRNDLSADPKRFKALAHSCANILKDMGQPLKSIELYSLSGEVKQATEIAMSNVTYMIYRADFEMLSKWAPAISNLIGGGLQLTRIFEIYGLIAIGKHDQAKALLRELKDTYEPNVDSNSIDFELEILQLRMHFTYGNFSEVYEVADRLPSESKINYGDHGHSRLAAFRVPLVAAFIQQDIKKFDKYFKSIDSDLREAQTPASRILVSSIRAMHNFLAGNYIAANEYAVAACAIADEIRAKGAFIPYEAAYVAADTFLELDREDMSSNIVEKYLQQAVEFKQYPWIAGFYAKEATIKMQRGQNYEALNSIRAGHQKIEGSLINSSVTILLDIHECIIQFGLGKMDRAAEIMYRLPEHELIRKYRESFEMMINPAGATEAIRNLPEGTDQERFRKEVFSAIVNTHKPAVAIAHLRKSLEYAVPNGYFRAYLNMPAKTMTYVLDIANQTPTQYLEKLSRAVRAKLSEVSRGSSATEESLTRRELDILRRLETGSPIAEIAKSVHISNNTIKTHLKNLYRKLKVSGRTEAVARGKELMLL